MYRVCDRREIQIRELCVSRRDKYYRTGIYFSTAYRRLVEQGRVWMQDKLYKLACVKEIVFPRRIRCCVSNPFLMN